MLTKADRPARRRLLLPALLLLAVMTFGASVALAGSATGRSANRQSLYSIAASPADTYYSTDVPKNIPDPGTVTSTLTIAAVGTISDLDVIGLTISHTLPADLSVVLVSPLGTSVTLFTHQCGGIDWNSSNTGFNLSDGALDQLGDACPPGNATYNPENPLSAFTGQPITGIWQLVISDNAPEDSGVLLAWGLASPGTPPQATLTPTVEATLVPQPSPTTCPVNFTDVHANDYFYPGVRYLFCKGSISGYNDDTYRPYNYTTRGQMTKIVVLGLNVPFFPPPSTPSFTDVPATQPFFAYIETAKLFNIVNGYNDPASCPSGVPCFHPSANVTRGQLIKMVVNGAGWDLINPTTQTFTDVPPNAPFYAEIQTAVCYGVISGYDDRTFRPGNNSTRGQIAKIVYLVDTNTTHCDAVPTPIPARP